MEKVMKTRLLALTAAISSVSMLTACSGGSGAGPSSFNAQAAPAPTVTLTVPAIATVGFAYNVSWTGSGTGCSANFDTDHTGTTASFSKTETTAGTKTYTVTCTNSTGSATDSKTIVVSDSPTAEGAWQGTTGDSRTVSGVVTKEGNYWLAYTQSGNGAIVGFYAGSAVSTATTPTDGSFHSGDLREVNFTGGFSGVNTAAGTLDSGAFTKKTSLSGSLNPVQGGAVISATFSNLTGTGSTGKGAVTLASVGSAPSTIHIGDTQVTVSMSTQYILGGSSLATLSTTEVFTGSLSGTTFTPTSGTTAVTACDDGVNDGTGLCATAAPPVGAPVALTTVGGSIDLAAGGSIQWAVGVPKSLQERKATYTFPAPTSTILSNLPSITADTFSLPTYNPAYEAAPVLATLAGSYTGSAGVGVAMQGSATFVVAADGSISGAAGSCNYIGSAVTHPTGGNVYDVTLTFSGAACAANVGEFKGVATLDANTHQVTVTTVNTAHDSGFLFVGVPAT